MPWPFRIKALSRAYRHAIASLDACLMRIDQWTRRYPRSTALLYGLILLMCVRIVHPPEHRRAADGQAVYTVEAR